MTRSMYYAFFPSILGSDSGFEAKIEDLCWELGEREKATDSVLE